jgi:Ion channel
MSERGPSYYRTESHLCIPSECKGRSIHAFTQSAVAIRPPTSASASARIARWPRAKHPRAVKLTRIWRGRWREQMLSAVLVIQLLILFVMPAARDARVPMPHFVVRGLLLMFIPLALIMARSRRAMAMVILSVALTFAASVWHLQRPELVADAASTVAQLLPQLAILWVVSSAVFGRGRATYHRILGAIVMYLGIGMIFVSLYIMLVHYVPDAFDHLAANPFGLRQALTYFSFSTLTTASFGDILPVHPIARSLANLEAICGQLFPTILLTRVVKLQGSKARASARAGIDD